MRKIIFMGLFLLLIVQAFALSDDVRQNVLVSGSKYKYQSVVEVQEGKYIPLFGLGRMILPEGEVPEGVLGSAAAIFSTGYQAKAKLGQTGPEEVLIAKEVKKSLTGSRVKSETVDKSKLGPPLEEQ